MQDYNFWADLLATFKSSPDWIKALWLLVPPGFILSLIAMLMRFRLALRREKDTGKDHIASVVYRNERLFAGDRYMLPDNALQGMLPPPSVLSDISPTRGEIG